MSIPLAIGLLGLIVGVAAGLQNHAPPWLLALLAFGGLIGGLLLGGKLNRMRGVSGSSRSYEAEESKQNRVGAYRGMYNDLDIVGESYRQPQILGFWRQGRADCTWEADLIPERNNPHDPSAVRVEIEGEHVAYLSRDSATEYRERMGTGRCRIPVHLIKGKASGSSIGVFPGRSKADNAATRAAREDA